MGLQSPVPDRRGRQRDNTQGDNAILLKVRRQARSQNAAQSVTPESPQKRGRKKSRIKAWRLVPPRRITSARSAGRRNENLWFSGNCHHVFRAFVQLVMWRQMWGTDARFDLLFPSTLTTATNLAVSTVAWQRNSQLFCKWGEQRYQNSTEKKKAHQQCLCPSYFGV